MLSLQTHQQEAYDNVKNYLSSGDRSIVIFPTGCGKSFVSLKLMEENRQSKILFVCPSEPIRNQMYQYIIKYLSTEETNNIIIQQERTKERELGLEEKVKIILPQFKALLYQTISSKNARVQGLLDKLDPDFIICDEVHHIKTKKEDDIENEKELLENIWGKAMVDLVNNNPQAKILGITATPERGDGVNVAIQFFDGKIASEISLIQALSRDDIPVKAPDYVPCVYTLLDEINEGSIQEQIESYKTSNPERAEELQQKLEEMRKIADSGKGISDLFTEHLTTPTARQLGRDKGKYIVFCDNIKDMKQKMEEAKTWFYNIDSEPEIYAVSSSYSSSPDNLKESEQVISSFEQSQSSHIKLLFSVNMLNEGLHVDDVTGVIMTRKTNSRNVYLQQLGRAISSNPDKPRPIVFDIANNYLTYNIYEELVNARKKQNETKTSSNVDKKEKTDDDSKYESDEDKWVETFKISGIMKDLLELLQEESKSVEVPVLLQNARQIKEWIEKNPSGEAPKLNSEDDIERWLALKLKDINVRLISPYLEAENDEERNEFIEKLESRKRQPITREQFEEIMQIMNEIKINKVSPVLVFMKRVQEWMEEKDTIKPPTGSSHDKVEARLGIRLSSIKNTYIIPYKSLETDEERTAFIKSLENQHIPLPKEQLEEVLKIYDEINKHSASPRLEAARQIEEWIKNNPDKKYPSSKSDDAEERNLGQKLVDLRFQLIKPFKELKTDEEREAYIEKMENWKVPISRQEFEEMYQIIESIDSKVKEEVPATLEGLRKVKEWMNSRNTNKQPQKGSSDPEEKSLATVINSVRSRIVNPYKKLKTDEERVEFIMKFKTRMQQPINEQQLQEIFEIIDWLDSVNPRKMKKNEIGQATFDISVLKCDEAENIMARLVQEQEKKIK